MDNVNAHAIAWAELISTFGQFSTASGKIKEVHASLYPNV